jgi:hypothetical protein
MVSAGALVDSPDFEVEITNTFLIDQVFVDSNFYFDRALEKSLLQV